VSELPTNWVVSSIGDLISLNPKIECPDELPAGFVPMQMVGKEYSSPVRFETRPWGEIKKGYTHFANGDVLLAKITPCFENGKAGLVCGLPNGVGAGSTEYFVSRPHLDMLNSRYLYAFLKTEKFLKAGAVKMTGSVGHKRVPKDYLLETELPLAPLPEQKRIADKLDAVLARVDACRDRLDRIPAILKHFRQSVLAAATSGKLTEEWRLENRLLEPELTTLGEIIKVSSGKFLPAKNMTTGGTIPVYGGNGVNGYHDKGNVDSETLVIGRVGFYCGSVHLTPPRAWVTDNALIVRHDEKQTLKRFLYFALQATDLRVNDSSTAQPVISGAKIYPTPILVPHALEQTEIVRRVEDLFTCADRIEASYKAARAQVEKLTPATLAKAFRGELVPQDPNDEPASKLLVRIRASAERPAAKVTRGRRVTATK